LNSNGLAFGLAVQAVSKPQRMGGPNKDGSSDQAAIPWVRPLYERHSSQLSGIP